MVTSGSGMARRASCVGTTKVSCNTSKRGKLSSALKNFKQRLTQAPRRGYNTHMKNEEKNLEAKLIKRLEKLLSRPNTSASFRKLVKINIEKVLAA